MMDFLGPTVDSTLEDKFYTAYAAFQPLFENNAQLPDGSGATFNDTELSFSYFAPNLQTPTGDTRVFASLNTENGGSLSVPACIYLWQVTVTLEASIPDGQGKKPARRVLDMLSSWLLWEKITADGAAIDIEETRTDSGAYVLRYTISWDYQSDIAR